jgi:CBS domain-containing protein
MTHTHVKDLMESDLEQISPDATLQDAAQKMKDVNCGFLPVGSGKGQAPQGIITDRDIIIRAIAAGKDPKTEKVSAYMTKDCHTCKDTDSLEDAARMMNENAVSRLVVRDSKNEICGVLSFGRMLRACENRDETSSFVQQVSGQAA